MNPVEHYISAELLKDIQEKLDPENRGFVPAEYKGYISSLGASIILSGMVPALAFYNDGTREDNPSGSAQPRKPVLDILESMLKRQSYIESDKSLFQAALDANNDKRRARRLEKEIVHASIAFKLALRTFKLKKQKPGRDE